MMNKHPIKGTSSANNELSDSLGYRQMADSAAARDDSPSPCLLQETPHAQGFAPRLGDQLCAVSWYRNYVRGGVAIHFALPPRSMGN
jgi:hypothetical protein